MLILPLILGVIFPQGRVLAGSPYHLIRWALCIMIFINVLQIEWSDLRPRREHWVLLAANILMGLLPCGLLKILWPSSDMPSLAAFFTGIAPTAAASAVIVSLLNGQVGFTVTGFIITNIGIACALVFLLPLVTGNISMAFLIHVASSMISVVFLPLLLARIVRYFFPAILRYMTQLKELSLIMWSFTLYIIAGIATCNIQENSDASVAMLVGMAGIALVLCIINFSFGYFIGRPQRSRECSQLLGQKNTTFAIFVALEYSSGIAALSTVFYVLFHNLWNSFQLISARRKTG